MTNPLSNIISDSDYGKVKTYLNKIKVKYYHIFCEFAELRNSNPGLYKKEIYKMVSKKHNMAFDTVRKIIESYR